MTDFEDWGPPEPTKPPSCVACGSLLEAPDEQGWMRCPNGHGHFRGDTSISFTHEDLSGERAEDRAELRDYRAVDGDGLHRVMGGL